ncbi:hypothetical protein DFJ73DRAFT_962916 [Zopfochytrium polystomum]|nr:hypothetical protein DFJ73DRAFT_962916 [Zopfochytrium polystomum]
MECTITTPTARRHYHQHGSTRLPQAAVQRRSAKAIALVATTAILVLLLRPHVAKAAPASGNSNANHLHPRDPAPFPAPASNNNGLCGKNVGSCYPGFCCSTWGFCGNTTDHCGTGCQSAYGACTGTNTTSSSGSSGGATTNSTGGTTSTATTSTGSTTNTKSTTTTTSGSTSKSSSTTGTPTTSSTGTIPDFVSTTGQCGPTYGLCPLGLCCGKYGWCGSDPSSCKVSSGCDKRYGDCDGFPQDPKINIVYGCKVDKTVAITFDDGPYTTISTIANAFKAAGGYTTFFVNGDNADCIFDHAAALKAAYDDGHQIGAHTWSHPDITTLSEAELRREMGLLESAVKMITGARPNFFRPPFGSYNKTSVDIVADLGYTHFVLWDMTPQELSNNRGQSTSADVKNEKKTYNNADLSVPHIFLQHSQIRKTVSDMVPFIINWAQSKKLKMVTVADCLGTGIPKYRDIGQPTAKNDSWTCDI